MAVANQPTEDPFKVLPDMPGLSPSLKQSLNLTSNNTPARLRFLSLVILALAVAAGIVASIVVSDRATTTDRIRTVDEPSILVAREVQASLAEADASAATAFLAGGIENADQRLRYEAAIADAEASLSQLAALVAGDDESAAAVVTIQQTVSEYSGLIETARVNNRQGFPVGAAYLTNASDLLTNEVYPLTDLVANNQSQQYRSDVQALIGPQILLPIVAVALAVFLTIALLRTQSYIAGKFHRRFNPPLVIATIISLILALWLTFAFATQALNSSDARDDSYRTVREFVDARALAFRAKAAESRFLIARGGETTADFDAEASRTTDAIVRATDTGGSSFQLPQDEWSEYLAVHGQIIEAVETGDRTAAEQLALGASTVEFDEVDDAIVDRLEQSQAQFVSSMDAAHSATDFLTFGSLALTIAAAVLSFLGIQSRINEYR